MSVFQLDVYKRQILGPLLWNIVFEDFLTQNFGEDVHLVAYADDAMLVIDGRSRTDLELKANRALGVVTNWSKKAKLEFSADKTIAIMLNNKFHRERRPRLALNNEHVRSSSEVKYLGLLIQEEMVYTCLLYTSRCV